MGQGGESMVSDQALRHVITRLTDEGLVIELFDLPDVSLFQGDTDLPNPVVGELASVLARLFAIVENAVAVEGHLSAKSLLHVDYPVWSLSTGRAEQMRLMLEVGGLDPQRIERVTGGGDRDPVVQDATAPRNNRLEVILLRSERTRT